MPNMFEEFELELMAKAKAEIAKEDAAFAALAPEERARIIADRDARLEALADAIADDDGEEDESDEGEF